MTTITNNILDVVHSQLSAEAPELFLDLPREPADYFARCLSAFLDRIVKEAVDTAARAGISDDEARSYVHGLLSAFAHFIERCASAVFMSSCHKSAPPPGTVFITPTATREAKGERDEYLAALAKFAELVQGLTSDQIRMPLMTDAAKELAALPAVFDFLAQRRSALRRLMHRVPGEAGSTAQAAADRGDEVAALYSTQVLGGLAEVPENWSLIEQPDELRPAITAMLCDLHHVADAAGLDWAKLLAKGEAEYRQELGDALVP
jgi:hypothetical protein